MALRSWLIGSSPPPPRRLATAAPSCSASVAERLVTEPPNSKRARSSSSGSEGSEVKAISGWVALPRTVTSTVRPSLSVSARMSSRGRPADWRRTRSPAGQFELGPRKGVIATDDFGAAADARIVGCPAQDHIGRPFAVESHPVDVDTAGCRRIDQITPRACRGSLRRPIGGCVDLARGDLRQSQIVRCGAQSPAGLVHPDAPRDGSAQAIGNDPQRPGDRCAEPAGIEESRIARRGPQINDRSTDFEHSTFDRFAQRA